MSIPKKKFILLLNSKNCLPYELEALKTRFRIFSQAIELNFSKEKINRLLEKERVKAIEQFEKLDKKAKKEIPIQSKMMAIADICDALTAWDRSYKKAVLVEKALNILQWEVDEGKLDADLFQIFLDAKLYDLVKKLDDV